MLKIYITFLLLFITYFSNSFCQNDYLLIQNIIDQINLDSLTNYVELLTGEQELTINDTTVRLYSRYNEHIGNEIAGDYIKYKLESWGLEVYDSQYSATGRNIYAIQQGNLYPDQFYIICAHYDSYAFAPIPPDYVAPICPGADDNASGVANVLEAARILRNYDPAYSIIYALWDEEERVGALGSLHFTEQASLNNMDILGVINIDMIGYDGNNDNEFEVHLPDGDSSRIAQTILEVNSSFSIGMVPYVIPRGCLCSDHYWFYLYGYEALLFIERYYGNDVSPYHNTNDRIRYFNKPYFHNLSKISIGTLAVLAFDAVITDVKSTNEINDYLLEQNYPNPFNPTTKIRYQIPELSFVTLTVYDVLGNEISIIVNEEKPAGSYKIYFDGDGLSSGIYFYRIKAGSFIVTKKMMLLH